MFPVQERRGSPRGHGGKASAAPLCARKKQFASELKTPFFVTVNSTNLLYCCLYHFCTKNQKREKKKPRKKKGGGREESKCFQCVFSATAILVSKLITALLICCVSKLNWRADAWLRCNKNKVPLLNSLICFCKTKTSLPPTAHHCVGW